MYVKNLSEIFQPNKSFRQVFRYQLRAKIFGSGNAIMDMYDHGQITDQDIEMFKFLYDVKFATKEQILRRCPWLDETLFDANSKKWLREHFINAFFFTDETDNDFKFDAFCVYTVDFATITLLSHFSASQDLYNWNPRALIMPLALIKKQLLATDFRVAMETKLARTPLSYDSNRLFIHGRFRLIPNAQIFMNVARDPEEVLAKPYIVLTFTKDDFEYGDSTQVNELIGRYENWYEKEGWNRNFKEPPVIYFVADCAETLKDLQRIVEALVDMEDSRYESQENTGAKLYEQVRVTCSDLYNENLENCFIKYNAASGKWVRTRSFFLAEKQ